MKKSTNETQITKNQEDEKSANQNLTTGLTRRQTIKTLAVSTAMAAAATNVPLFGRYAQAQSSNPIKIGFQVHRTGIGAAYGRWYDRTTAAAVKKNK